MGIKISDIIAGCLIAIQILTVNLTLKLIRRKI